PSSRWRSEPPRLASPRTRRARRPCRRLHRATPAGAGQPRPAPAGPVPPKGCSTLRRSRTCPATWGRLHRTLGRRTATLSHGGVTRDGTPAQSPARQPMTIGGPTSGRVSRPTRDQCSELHAEDTAESLGGLEVEVHEHSAGLLHVG